jgi:hypothetical protein
MFLGQEEEEETIENDIFFAVRSEMRQFIEV